MSVILWILMALAMISLLYTGIIILYVGWKAAQLWLWPAFSFCCLVMILLDCFIHDTRQSWLLYLKWGIWTFGIAILSMVVILEVIILGYHKPEDAAAPSYILVLGAKVNGSRVSKALRERLDEAVLLADEYQNAKIILSGGKGPGEDISEAEAMKEYLVKSGISEERIIEEDKSTTTEENFRFSIKKMERSDMVVAVVTNRFHVYRSVQIGKKMGAINVYGVAAQTDPIMRVHYYVREAFAVLKYKLAGTI